MNKRFIYILSGFAAVLVLAVYFIHRLFFSPSVAPKSGTAVLFIPEGADYRQAIDTVYSHLTVDNPGALNWLAAKKKYQYRVRPGKYLINKSLSVNELIDILRSGDQTPVRITFNNIRTIEQLAGRFGKQLETDSLEFLAFFSDESNYKAEGFRRETIIALFIPDTYEFFWNTTAEGIYKRMLKEYERFWNDDRLKRAEEKGLTRIEVSILASIIDDEVNRKVEKPRIAGVYLNRLKRGIPLQACPTIKFALNDFTITRVLRIHLEAESPYNTYKYRGFPPGPIGCPSVEGIDAVLNAEEHNYLFFAAKADFSGYHNFSRTLSEHNRYAAEYQRELNKRRIYR
ncbi:MAG TPA: endolytic transglycosylase MltG [Bacteroidales bacterium]|nr:endolytic transglycosylase MltG [Bacteroidales bacterium]